VSGKVEEAEGELRVLQRNLSGIGVTFVLGQVFNWKKRRFGNFGIHLHCTKTAMSNPNGFLSQ